MIVPRSFTGHASAFNEKSEYKSSSRRSSRATSRATSRSTSPFSRSISPLRTPHANQEPRSDPVQIPTRNNKDNVPRSIPEPTSINFPSIQHGDGQSWKPRKETAKDILYSTTIPARRKLRGRPSQRLPKCDYVADFSRLLLEDLKTGEGNVSKSVSGSYVDGLFGNIDGLVDGQMIVGSMGVDDNVLATRSISSDSLASLASPEDYGTSGILSHRSSLGRSHQDKKSPTSEACLDSHPLVETEDGEEDAIESMALPPPARTVTGSSNTKKSKSFKSSLTASLKAIKSAAQTVSQRAGSIAASTSDDYLTRSFFDIQPFLTDDKRPPPMNIPPSAQLRRYLNPYSSAPPDSPLQLHFWQEDRHQPASKLAKRSKLKARRKLPTKGTISPPSIDELPSIVQLATCLPPSVRTEHASSPPIWLDSNGMPSNRKIASPLRHDPETLLETPQAQIRQREPRENRDFLRIFVCEMAMRKQGKLSDDLSIGRAKLWLPPVNDGSKNHSQSTSTETETTECAKPKTGEERWHSWTADDLL